MKLAVLNCKKTKQNYTCSAEEMYSKSSMFRAQLNFVKAYYDAYVILSAKHGVLLPTDIIEPYTYKMYGMTGYSKNKHIDKDEQMTLDELEIWKGKVRQHPIWDDYDEIHFHTSQYYYVQIGNIHPNQQHNKQPAGTGFVLKHYERMLNEHESGTDVNLNVLEQRDSQCVSKGMNHSSKKMVNGV